MRPQHIHCSVAWQGLESVNPCKKNYTTNFLVSKQKTCRIFSAQIGWNLQTLSHFYPGVAGRLFLPAFFMNYAYEVGNNCRSAARAHTQAIQGRQGSSSELSWSAGSALPWQPLSQTPGREACKWWGEIMARSATIHCRGIEQHKDRPMCGKRAPGERTVSRHEFKQVSSQARCKACARTRYARYM